MATTALPGVRALPPSAGRATLPRSPVPAVVGGAGCAAVLLSSAWLAVAAAAGPSQLSPPTRRPGGDVGWLLGPLHGVLAWPVGSVADLHRWLLIATAVATGGWILAWAGAPALGTRVVLCVSGAAQALLLLGPPQPLTDVFNYVVYGRMAALRPEPLRRTRRGRAARPGLRAANWHHLPSPYGPLFTLLSEPLALLPPAVASGRGRSSSASRASPSLALVAPGWRAAWAARRSGRSRCSACAPCRSRSAVGGLHNDAPALLCVVAAAWCLLRGRGDGGRARWTPPPVRSPSLAAAIKPSFAIVVPLVVLGAHAAAAGARGRGRGGRRRRGSSTLVAFGGALPAARRPGRARHAAVSVPNLLGLAAGHGGADAAVRGGRARRARGRRRARVGRGVPAPRRALPAMAVVLLARVLTLSWVMPWYLVWALPFAALAPARAGAAVAVVVACGSASAAAAGCRADARAGLLPDAHATGLANHQLRGAAGPMSAELARVARFALVGVANTLITLAAFAAARRRSASPRRAASALAFALGAVNGYQLNRRWTFRGVAAGRRVATSRCRRSAPRSSAAGVALARGDGLPRLAAELVVLPVVTLLTYALSRRLVFGPGRVSPRAIRRRSAASSSCSSRRRGWRPRRWRRAARPRTPPPRRARRLSARDAPHHRRGGPRAGRRSTSRRSRATGRRRSSSRCRRRPVRARLRELHRLLAPRRLRAASRSPTRPPRARARSGTSPTSSRAQPDDVPYLRTVIPAVVRRRAPTPRASASPASPTAAA